jgi:hypothetical protein
MAASLDGFIALRQESTGSETADHFPAGDTMDARPSISSPQTINCYVMGSRTYETALRFEARIGGRMARPTFD